MTDLLYRAQLNPRGPTHALMDAGGGIWATQRPFEPPNEIVAEAKARGITGLSVRHDDVAWLAELPDLEVLKLSAPHIEPVNELRSLRVLVVHGPWTGVLDLGRMPRLEVLSVGTWPTGQDVASTIAPARALRALFLGKAPVEDLRPFAGLAIERLNLHDNRELRSLGGVDALAPTLTWLTLASLPGLPSLGGLEALSRLEFLKLDDLKQISTLEMIRSLPSLRFLSVGGQRLDSLAGIANHRGLEFLELGKHVADRDLDPVATLPGLRLLAAPNVGWNRDLSDFPKLSGLASDDPLVVEWQRIVLG